MKYLVWFAELAKVYELKGDFIKAKQKLNWESKVSFKELVKIMVDADFERNKGNVFYERKFYKLNEPNELN